MTDELEISIDRTFGQVDFDRFARLSGDDNPIHVDPAYSAGTRFGRPVAHGLFLCSVLRGLLDELLPGGRLLEQSVMFPAPTYAGDPMRFVVKLVGEGTSVSRLNVQLQVMRISDGVVTCQGESRVAI